MGRERPFIEKQTTLNLLYQRKRCVRFDCNLTNGYGNEGDKNKKVVCRKTDGQTTDDLGSEKSLELSVHLS